MPARRPGQAAGPELCGSATTAAQELAALRGQELAALRCRGRGQPTAPSARSPRSVSAGATESVGVGAAVVLEDEADGREHDEEHADQEQPPANGGADGGDRAGQTGEQRPPAVRAEEAKLPGPLSDLAPRVVLWPQRQPAPGEQDVEAAEERQAHRQGQGRSPGWVVREVPIHDVRTGEKYRAADEQVPFDLHLRPLRCLSTGRQVTWTRSARAHARACPTGCLGSAVRTRDSRTGCAGST